MELKFKVVDMQQNNQVMASNLIGSLLFQADFLIRIFESSDWLKRKANLNFEIVDMQQNN